MNRRHRPTLWVAAVLLVALFLVESVGCEDDDTAARIEVEPAPSPPAPEAESTPELEAEPPSDGPLVPEWEARLGSGQLRTRRMDGDEPSDDMFEYDQVEHPVESVRVVINEASREHGFATFRGVMGMGECEATLATPTLVSFLCNASDQTGRGGPVQRVRASTLHLEIVDDEVIPFAMDSAIRGATDLVESLVAECERRRTESQPSGFYSECSAERSVIVMSLHAIEVRFRGNDGGSIDFERTYEELGDAIRADGPLASLLGLESPPAPEATAEPSATPDWAVTGFEATHRVLERWRAMPRAAAAQLRVERHRSILARLVAISVSEERAAELAQILGTRARPLVRRGEPETIGWVRTTSELTIREPESVGAITDRDALAIVPRGALLIAVGELGRRRGSWSEVLAGGIFGFAASRLMTPHRGCMPEPPDALDARRLVRAIMQARVDGIQKDVVVFANEFGPPGPTWDEIDDPLPVGQVWIHEYDPATCAVGASVLHVDHEGAMVDVRFGSTAQGEGDALLIIGQAPYEVRRLTDDEPLFSRGEPGRASWVSTSTLRSGEVVDGVYYPVTMVGSENLLRLRWNGDGFDQLAAPNPDYVEEP